MKRLKKERRLIKGKEEEEVHGTRRNRRLKRMESRMRSRTESGRGMEDWLQQHNRETKQ